MMPPGEGIESWTPYSRSGWPGIDTTPDGCQRFGSLKRAAFLAQDGKALEAKAEQGLELSFHADLRSGSGRRLLIGDDGQGSGLVGHLIGPNAQASDRTLDVSLDAHRLAVVVGGIIQEIADRGDARASPKEKGARQGRQAGQPGGVSSFDEHDVLLRIEVAEAAKSECTLGSLARPLDTGQYMGRRKAVRRCCKSSGSVETICPRGST